VDRLQTLSDHRDASFGTSYGVLIKELRLLARAIFLVDRKGVLQYKELVKEVTHEPDYKAALNELKKLV
jgi:thiol peroxidase